MLDDEQRATAELRTFVRAVGRALVEASTVELGRQPAALRRLAGGTGVHVVASTGHVCEQYWRARWTWRRRRSGRSSSASCGT